MDQQSSFNRPSLPPGYDRDYVPPGQQQSSHQASRGYQAQGSTSNGGGGGGQDTWGNDERGNGRREGLVARGPQVTESPTGRRRIENDEDDYGVRGNDSEETLTGLRQPQEGFVRVRIMGLDRNRRDMYIKFNAEVSFRFSSAFRESVPLTYLLSSCIIVKLADISQLYLYVRMCQISVTS